MTREGAPNRLLAAVFSAEARWLRTRDLPLGISLLALASARPADHLMTARSGWRPAYLALIVAGGVLALEVAYGVALGEALLYAAYEVGFVVLPGWLAY